MKSDVRKPPMRAVLCQHPQGVRGTCGWCGLECLDKTPVREWLKYYHDACSDEMAVITDPSAARRAVLDRDHGICCDCGEDWSERFRLVPDGYVSSWGLDRAQAHPENYTTGPDGKRLIWLSGGDAPYVSLTAISLWHVDHKVPLWKARHLPDLQRIEFFKLANLITRCHKCHAFKTGEEAGEREKWRKQVDGKSEKPKRQWPSRPMRNAEKPEPVNDPTRRCRGCGQEPCSCKPRPVFRKLGRR